MLWTRQRPWSVGFGGRMGGGFCDGLCDVLVGRLWWVGCGVVVWMKQEQLYSANR